MITIEPQEPQRAYGEVRSVEGRGFSAAWFGDRGNGYAVFRYPEDALSRIGFDELDGVYQFGEDPDETIDELMARSRKRRRSGLLRVYTRKNPHYRRRHNDNCTLVALALGAIGFLVGRASK